MSEIIEHDEKNNQYLQTDVKIKDKKYFVSSVFTFDHGYETMVFKMTGTKIVFTGIFAKRHSSYESMREFHMQVIKNLEEYIHG